MVKWMQEKVEGCVAREGTLRGGGGRNSTGGKRDGGEGKERKDERPGESTDMKKKSRAASEKRQT